jgi:hypothetical protein
MAASHVRQCRSINTPPSFQLSPTQPDLAHDHARKLHRTLRLTYQRALHCLADLRTNSELIRLHWFNPYFITAALRISSWQLIVERSKARTRNGEGQLAR